MKKISLFTPCYNEEGNVYELYQKVTEVMKKLPQYSYEYVFIDNHSTDKTPEILKKIASEDSRVKVIFNISNFGPSRSGSYGFYQTTGDVSICLACDFQDPPELIPEFIKKWEEGYKVVWGKKTGAAESKLMYGIRCLYYKIIKMFADSKQYENVTGFGLYDKEVMDLFRKMNDPTPNLRNLVGEFGYEVGMVEYYKPERKSGKSSYNFFRYYIVAINSLVVTSRTPLRIATFMGIAVAGLSFFATLIYVIVSLLLDNCFSVGYVLLACGLFFFGGVQLFFLGILGEYVGEILVRQMNRPLVIEQERVNFEEQ